MSTKMDEDDWKRTRLRCSAPACRGVDGRPRTIAALPRGASFLHRLENVRWRALPERAWPFGWNSVWKRFRSLDGKAGVFEAFFDTLASCMSSTADLIRQMFDLDHRARSCVGGREQKGARRTSAGAQRVAASPRRSTQNRTPQATSSPST